LAELKEVARMEEEVGTGTVVLVVEAATAVWS
jgi:hypothetical protein